MALALLQLIAAVGMPIDARVLLLEASVVLVGAGLALVLRRVLSAASPAREDPGTSVRRRTPALAAIVTETVLVAAGRPEPRAPARGPSTALARPTLA